MVATPSVPGAIVVPVLTGNEIVGIATAGPQSAQTTTGAIAALATTFDNSVVQTVTAAVGTTYTVAQFLSGVIARSGPSAVYTDVTPNAADLVTQINPLTYPTSFTIDIQNLTNFTETITGGTGMTVAANTVIAANSVGEFLVTLTSATAGTVYRIFSGNLSDPPSPVITALTTVGAGTITAAGIAGGVTNRTGSTAAFTDTTDIAANIIAALPNAAIGNSFLYVYQNNTVAPATLTGGTGVTVSGITVVPPSSSATFVITYTAAATVTMVGIDTGAVLSNSGTFVCNQTTPVTVANTAVTANSQILVTLKTVGGTVGATPAVKTITPGTGFTIAGTASDTSTYNYLILT